MASSPGGQGRRPQSLPRGRMRAILQVLPVAWAIALAGLLLVLCLPDHGPEVRGLRSGVCHLSFDRWFDRWIDRSIDSFNQSTPAPVPAPPPSIQHAPQHHSTPSNPIHSICAHPHRRPPPPHPIQPTQQGSPLLVLLVLGIGLALYSGAALGYVYRVDSTLFNPHRPTNTIHPQRPNPQPHPPNTTPTHSWLVIAAERQGKGLEWGRGLSERELDLLYEVRALARGRGQHDRSGRSADSFIELASRHRRVLDRFAPQPTAQPPTPLPPTTYSIPPLSTPHIYPPTTAFIPS